VPFGGWVEHSQLLPFRQQSIERKHNSLVFDLSWLMFRIAFGVAWTLTVSSQISICSPDWCRGVAFVGIKPAQILHLREGASTPRISSTIPVVEPADEQLNLILPREEHQNASFG
jgi:hypothetical protein